jgi:hypothetical protein
MIAAAIGWNVANMAAAHRAVAAANAAVNDLPVRQVGEAAVGATPVAPSLVTWGGALVPDENGQIVLAGAEVTMAAGESHRVLVPQSLLPLHLRVSGPGFSVVKPDAPKTKIGIYTGDLEDGDVPLDGCGTGPYKFFPLNDAGQWTHETELTLAVTVTTNTTEVEFDPSPNKKLPEKPEA